VADEQALFCALSAEMSVTVDREQLIKIALVKLWVNWPEKSVLEQSLD